MISPSFPVDSDTLAYIAMWVVNFIYFLGIFPQIYMNWQRRSAEGLSSVMLYGYVLAYIFQIFYTYCLDMPRSYKIMLPISLCTVLLLIAQKIYYSDFLARRAILTLYFITFAGATLLIPLARYAPITVGHYAGWIAMFIWTVYMLPQGLKMYVDRSVAGFSFSYVTYMTMGSLLESTSALVLSNGTLTSFWPLIYNGFRGLTGYVIFCIQFLLYRRK